MLKKTFYIVSLIIIILWTQIKFIIKKWEKWNDTFAINAICIFNDKKNHG
jgi:hypothetical protein